MDNETIQTIEIEEIILNEAMQPRADISQETVQEYAEDIQAGTEFPPVDVFVENGRYILADGFHRVRAFQQANKKQISAKIHEGGIREATLFAAGANASNGLRRTNADKIKAVSMLLNDEEYRVWSDGEIARRCAVSQPFVSKIRNEMTNNGYESPTLRHCANGRTMNVSQIGKKPYEGRISPSVIMRRFRERLGQSESLAQNRDSSSLPNPSTPSDPSASVGDYEHIENNENSENDEMDASEAEECLYDEESEPLSTQPQVNDPAVEMMQLRKRVAELEAEASELYNRVADLEKALDEKDAKNEQLEMEVRVLRP